MKLAEFKYWPQVGICTLLLVCYGVYYYFAYYNTRSEDAYVSAHIVNIAAIVSGPVRAIYVVENQSVKKGEKLIEIDPFPYQEAVKEATAQLNTAKVNYESNQLAVLRATKQLEKTQAALNLTIDHYKRYQELMKHNDTPAINLINLQDKITEQQAEVSVAEQDLKIAQTNDDNSGVLAAKARLEKALYLLNHTVLYAPEEGYVTNFNVRSSQYVQQGDGLFALIETKRWWVVARYRETALRLVRPGDKAIVSIDMYPGKKFKGHVESIGWGINRVQQGEMAYSTLVYLEPTEDWIRIAQRFPVRIVIDEVSPEYPLRIGASAETITYR